MAEFTLAGVLRRHAAERPDAPAVTDAGVTLGFAELDRRTSRVASGLVALGLGPGDRVAVIARNGASWYETLLGAAKCGAVTVGVNWRLAPREVSAVLADAAPSLVVVDADLRHLVEEGPEPLTFGGGYEDWRDAHDAVDPHGDAPDDVVVQLYSSGTTGQAKGAMLTNANLSWTPRMGVDAYAMGPDSVNLVTSPLFHVGGVGYSLTAFGLGGHTVMLRAVDPVAMLGAVERYGVTHAFMVPTVIRSLLDALGTAPADLSSLQMVAYGAAPIDERTLVAAIAAFGSRFLGVYGMTETAGSVTALRPDDHDPGGPRAGLLRSVGRPLPWHEVIVADPVTGLEAEPGVVGEVRVRSPQNMAGYWHRPDLDAATLLADGWLATGDAAWRDGDGYLYIHDRLKDMIISGGENIYPAEVERVLYEHPSVREVVVVGVPHPKWGETVKAVVVADSATVSGEELVAFARDRLAHYKCPTSVDFVASLERNASGKILKRSIRQGYIDAAASPA